MLAVSPVIPANLKPDSVNDAQSLEDSIFAINPVPDTLKPFTPAILPYPSVASAWLPVT